MKQLANVSAISALSLAAISLSAPAIAQTAPPPGGSLAPTGGAGSPPPTCPAGTQVLASISQFAFTTSSNYTTEQQQGIAQANCSDDIQGKLPANSTLKAILLGSYAITKTSQTCLPGLQVPCVEGIGYNCIACGILPPPSTPTPPPATCTYFVTVTLEGNPSCTEDGKVNTTVSSLPLGDWTQMALYGAVITTPSDPGNANGNGYSVSLPDTYMLPVHQLAYLQQYVFIYPTCSGPLEQDGSKITALQNQVNTILNHWKAEAPQYTVGGPCGSNANYQIVW